MYRVAHNVASSHISRRLRAANHLVELDAPDAEPGFMDGEAQTLQQYLPARIFEQIYLLKPLDRQIMLLYLEGETASSISDITGLSAANVATKIHRLKRLLSRESGEGVIHADR